jgi:hypothetical protein
MLKYLMRQALLDAFACGPPYHISTNHVPAVDQVPLLTELERLGFITRHPGPALTEAGIAEAEWLAKTGKRKP